MQMDSGIVGFIEGASKRMQDTVTALRDRAALVEESLSKSAAGAATAVAAVDGETSPDLAAIQASIRSVITYIRENPVPATLLAVGAGMIATSMWSERSGRGRSRRRR